MLIAIGAMAFSFFGIARPIGRITDSMSVLAGGDVKAEIPFAERKDEIGSMAAAVQVFKDNMIKARELEAAAVETEKRNAAQRKADMHKLADEFEAAVGEIVQTVSSASTELEASASTLTRTAETTQKLSTSGDGAIRKVEAWWKNDIHVRDRRPGAEPDEVAADRIAGYEL